MNYSDVITIEPGKRGGKPCIRGLRITVYDVLEYLAGGMSHADVLREFPYLTEEDIRACLAYAADRERKADISNVLSPRESTNELSSRPSDWIGFANPITRGGTCCSGKSCSDSRYWKAPE